VLSIVVVFITFFTCYSVESRNWEVLNNLFCCFEMFFDVFVQF
jgi:hypothetical protein